jgi:hypothetical protein
LFAIPGNNIQIHCFPHVGDGVDKPNKGTLALWWNVAKLKVSQIGNSERGIAQYKIEVIPGQPGDTEYSKSHNKREFEINRRSPIGERQIIMRKIKI